MGSYVFFTFDDEDALSNVKWVYLAIAIFVFILAIVFFMSTIPEITDADMAHQANETNANADDKPFWKQYRLFHATFAQFCYTGAQIAIASFFINYVKDTKGTSDDVGAQFLAGAQGAFAVGRFFGVFLMKYFRPRKVFLVFLTACVVFVAPSITQRGNAGMSMLYVTLFFESICFPTIVALGMRGLGRHTKRGSGFIVGGVIGGAVVSPLTGVAADSFKNTATAMVVPLVFFVAALSYAVAVNFVPAYRNPADAFSTTEIGLQSEVIDEEVAKVGLPADEKIINDMDGEKR